jgi:hypothetical protein
MREHLEHVVAAATEQLLERELQRVRARSSQSGSDDPKRHGAHGSAPHHDQDARVS